MNSVACTLQLPNFPWIYEELESRHLNIKPLNSTATSLPHMKVDRTFSNFHQNQEKRFSAKTPHEEAGLVLWVSEVMPRRSEHACCTNGTHASRLLWIYALPYHAGLITLNPSSMFTYLTLVPHLLTTLRTLSIRCVNISAAFYSYLSLGLRR